MRKLAMLCAVVVVSALACSSSSTAPSSALPSGTYQSAITPAIAMMSGGGGVSVTPKSIPEGTMDVDISITLTGVMPNTTYFVQRAPEVGRALSADGICQRALGLSPWSPSDPPAAPFVTFPLGTGSATLTTSAIGTGSLDFEFRSPTIPAGTAFDVMFRLVDNETAPTAELRSGCFTVTVK